MAYNPYSAINAIYNLKNEWDAADKSGDTAAKNKAASNAQVFYKQLRDNGQRKLADELSALDASGAKYILDQYSAKNSGVDNQAYNTSMQSATNKNNTLAGYIDSDRNDVQGKYNDIYNYANQDITKTDEYKSTYDRMMNKYDMSALNARDNAVASGGASNGGNIDSYAAANAMRQQASLIATGQQVAHQAGLDAYNSRISNVSNILNNLGVYNSGTYDAMNQTIANDANLAQQYFDNSETAKNNETARQEVYSNISGTVGDKVTKYLNSNVWNDDGSLVNSNQDFQAQINSLEKTLYSTKDETERARIKEQLRVLEAARNQKIDEQGLTYGKTYKYQSDKQTEAGRQFDEQTKLSRDALNVESDTTKYVADKEKEAKVTENLLKVSEPTLTIDQAIKAIKDGEITQTVIDAYNYHRGTSYTVENPPDLKDNDKGNGGDDETYAPYKSWADSGKNAQHVTINANEDYYSTGCDQYGASIIDAVIKAYANGDIGDEETGKVTDYEIVDFLVTNSPTYHTDKKQLKKVLAYFAIDNSFLDIVEDVGKGKNLSGPDYKYGVKYVGL